MVMKSPRCRGATTTAKPRRTKPPGSFTWRLLPALVAIVPLAAPLLLVCANAFAQTSAVDVAPPPGNPERKAILDALRVELRRYQDQPMVFVVRHLRVNGRWAWVDVNPQSPDATQHYESVSALLRSGRGGWTVVEMPCAEEDNPDCITDPGYFMRLRSRWPEVPPSILPSPE
jgi:hypothetical protein